MLRPSAFCDLASLPRSRSSRPSVGAISSISGRPGLGRLRERPAVPAGPGVSGWRGRGLGSGAGSGSSTSEMVRRGASRGMAASSPTAGSPVVSSRSAAVVWLKVMPEDAV